MRVLLTQTSFVIVQLYVPSANLGGHDKDLRVAAEFDISKYSARHDMDDNCVWEDHHERERRLRRTLNGEEGDDR